VSARLDLKRVVTLARGLVSLFETAVESLQTAQGVIPAPTLEELAEMRRGERPLTPEAYLLGLCHRSLLAAENLASDWREIDLKTLSHVHERKLSEIELNEIEQAVAERWSKP
jgi:hypothetical protein